VVRQTLATLASQQHRPIWEVVLDAVNTADVVARDAKRALLEGETMTAEQVDRMLDYAKLAHTMGNAAITTRAYEHASTSAWGSADRYAIKLTLDVVLRRLVRAFADAPGVRDWVEAAVEHAAGCVEEFAALKGGDPGQSIGGLMQAVEAGLPDAPPLRVRTTTRTVWPEAEVQRVRTRRVSVEAGVIAERGRRRLAPQLAITAPEQPLPPLRDRPVLVAPDGRRYRVVAVDETDRPAPPVTLSGPTAPRSTVPTGDAAERVATR
jgi:hypothetical protein